MDARGSVAYWRARLFRNSYTRGGHRRHVQGWRVKIQREGVRRTYPLRAADPDAAAREALTLFRSLVGTAGRQGMDGGTSPIGATSAGRRTESPVDSGAARIRLVRRPHAPVSVGSGGWSVWLEREGQGHYFPLGTEDPVEAEARARRLRLELGRAGMRRLLDLHPREATVAIRWCSDPVLWTYFSIHTAPGSSPKATPVRRARVGTRTRLQVAVVEPDAGLRTALVAGLESESGCRVVASWDRAAEAMGGLARNPANLLLVNQTLDGISGSDFLARVRVLEPGLASLVYSVCADSDELFKSTPGGAVGYLLRRTPSDRILEALEGSPFPSRPDPAAMALRVRRYFQQLVGAPVLSGGSAELSGLTPRELEILALMSKGFLDKEIAHGLRISVWTVHGHAKKIYEKLRVHSRTEAVVRYLQK